MAPAPPAAAPAGVLPFHPHTPALPTATASTATTSTSATATATATASAGATATTSGSSGISGTATGDAIPTQYGNAQVKVTVEAGKMVRIEALQLQGNDPRSVQISSSAAPVLEQEALSAQTADIDAVSGATFTSASYSQSLQSALDKLGFKAADGSVATLQVPAGGGPF